MTIYSYIHCDKMRADKMIFLTTMHLTSFALLFTRVKLHNSVLEAYKNIFIVP